MFLSLLLAIGFFGTFVGTEERLGTVIASLQSTRSMISALEPREERNVETEEKTVEPSFLSLYFVQFLILRTEEDSAVVKLIILVSGRTFILIF